MCVAYTALLNGQKVVLKTPLPDTSHAAVAANDLEVQCLRNTKGYGSGWCWLCWLVCLWLMLFLLLLLLLVVVVVMLVLELMLLCCLSVS